jgi:four helix bundle protein
MTSTIITEPVAKLPDITTRAFAFAVRIINLCKLLEKHSAVGRVLINQLLDAGTSVGANLEEAVAAQSRADFIHKNAVALKEARESNYWLRLILATNKFPEPVANGIQELVQESGEISKIVAKRIVTTKKTASK